MNRRIEELSEEALKLVAKEHSRGDVSRLNVDSDRVKQLLQENFSELIIKECAALCYHLGRDSGPITADLNKIRISTLLEGI